MGAQGPQCVAREHLVEDLVPERTWPLTVVVLPQPTLLLMLARSLSRALRSRQPSSAAAWTSGMAARSASGS